MTEAVPLVAVDVVHPLGEAALQLVALVLLQVRVEALPLVTDVGDALRVTVGAGVVVPEVVVPLSVYELTTRLRLAGKVPLTVPALPDALIPKYRDVGLPLRAIVILFLVAVAAVDTLQTVLLGVPVATKAVS